MCLCRIFIFLFFLKWQKNNMSHILYLCSSYVPNPTTFSHQEVVAGWPSQSRADLSSVPCLPSTKPVGYCTALVFCMESFLPISPLFPSSGIKLPLTSAASCESLCSSLASLPLSEHSDSPMSEPPSMDRINTMTGVRQEPWQALLHSPVCVTSPLHAVKGTGFPLIFISEVAVTIPFWLILLTENRHGMLILLGLFC